MPGNVTLEAGRFLITADWNPELVQLIRGIPGRRVEANRVWSVPEQYGFMVQSIANHFGMDMPEWTAPAEAPVTVGHRPGMFELRFDYKDQALVKSAAGLPGASWFQPSECWLVPEREGIAVNGWAEAHGARVSDKAEDAIGYAFEAGARFLASAAPASPYCLSRPGFGLELYPEQRAGVEYAILHAGGRVIIGDEPGVGKTAQALAILHELHAFPAVIICPASLKVNWRREAKRALPYATVEIIRGTTPQPRLIWADVVIINYDILPSWIGNLPVTPLGVVADESHAIKNPAIARTKATIALMEEVPEGTGARLCLTGTPAPNNTNEFMTQLEAIGQIKKFGGIHKARKRWHGRPVEFNRLLRETCYIRRMKKDVWPADSPDRNWADLYVEGDPGIMKQYREAERDIVAYLGEQARKAAVESGRSDEEGQRAAWVAAMRAQSAEHLVAITHLKRLAARAAMPACKEWARDFLAQGQKLGVFGWHTEIVDHMAEELNAVKVQGGMTEGQRQRSVDLFQSRPEVKVFVGQIKAAGEGLTLTAASNCLLMEQGWNQATHDQVLDRFHRRGQVNDVVGYVAMIEDTITEDIQKLIRRKQVEVSAAVDGVIANDSGSILSDLVVLMAERGMEK
jgi:SNF2 family DNA or RNA helicase